MASEPPNGLGPVIINGHIDTSNLADVADAVVRGCTIVHAEIKDLRALIEAVQQHPGATLAPVWKTGDPPPADEPLEVTPLTIRGGRIARCACDGLSVRITLTAKTSFAQNASFDQTDFVELALFDMASFEQGALFSIVRFAEAPSFNGARFEAGAYFRKASFERGATFNKSQFAGEARFVGARFKADASFSAARFTRSARFNESRFENLACFDGSTFANEANFSSVLFRGGANFNGSIFAGYVSFTNTRFSRSVSFMGTSYACDVNLRLSSFGDAVFCDGITHVCKFEFKEASFEVADIRGDFRGVDCSKASVQSSYRQARCHPWLYIPHWVVRMTTWFTEGWSRVRALGQLAILNRVSVVALFAVPILAAIFSAAQSLTADASGPAAPAWVRWSAHLIGDTPRLSTTLALTFIAAVLVTIGLFIYQTFAPDVIKAHDEDEHVRDVEARYSDQNTSLRRDGLRRSIERLEDQAKVRFGRHPRFVKHHGDLIWIPPADKPEWFDDASLPDEAATRKQAEATVRKAREACKLPVDDAAIAEAMKELEIRAPKDRAGFVPGVERARICIEEGARAEYWLKSHEKVWGAWASLACYVLGVMMLLVIVVMQCVSVSRAAWWPESPAKAGDVPSKSMP